MRQYTTVVLCTFVVCLMVLALGCKEEDKIIILPGQERPASDLLLAAIQEVQERTDRPIQFLNISNHPFPSVRNARGHHDWDNEYECIWLNPNLTYDDQEAVAAHELAHVLQKAEG